MDITSTTRDGRKKLIDLGWIYRWFPALAFGSLIPVLAALGFGWYGIAGAIVPVWLGVLGLIAGVDAVQEHRWSHAVCLSGLGVSMIMVGVIQYVVYTP